MVQSAEFLVAVNLYKFKGCDEYKLEITKAGDSV